MEQLRVLRAVLSVRELPPLRDQPLRAPTYALAMFPATRRAKGHGPKRGGAPGVLVMRPGQLVFLEDSHLWPITREIFHRVPDDFHGLTLSALLHQLQLLPEAEFDRCLEDIVRAGEGSRWFSSDVTHGITADDKYQVLLPDGAVLTGTPDAAQHVAIGRVLQLGRART
jgi:hypothetical protein